MQEEAPTNPTSSRHNFKARQNIQPKVKARTTDDDSEAMPASPESLSGTAAKALPINTIMGKVQTMPATARTKTSFFSTTYACARCAKDRRATQKDETTDAA